MPGTRRQFSAQQKGEIVRRHLSGKEPVSALADKFQVQPSLIHLWVKQVLEQAERAFERSASGGRPARRAEEAKDLAIEQLRAKLVQKNEVIAELMEENVRAKKANGDL
jgi:transposase